MTTVLLQVMAGRWSLMIWTDVRYSSKDDPDTVILYLQRKDTVPPFTKTVLPYALLRAPIGLRGEWRNTVVPILATPG
jgi:hypothetical protein